MASQKTAAHISLYASEEQKTWEEIIHQKSIEAKRKGDSPASEEKKKYYLNASSDLNTYYLDLKSSVIVPPNLTFSDSLTLYDSGMEIQLKYFGAGHTPGDIVVLVLPDKVLVTGDLVHDFEPLFPDADPDSWIRILEKIQQMDFNYFVGGHGDMHQGKIIISLWENYMEELKTKTLAAIAQGLTLQGFQNEIAIESFASLQNGYGERIQRFRTSYMKYLTGPLLDAVKDEIGSLWKFYGGN